MRPPEREGVEAVMLLANAPEHRERPVKSGGASCVGVPFSTLFATFYSDHMIFRLHRKSRKTNRIKPFSA
jgi:hypothetical protein